MIRPGSLRATFLSLLCAVTAASFACISSGNVSPGTGVDGGFDFDAALLDGGLPDALVIVDGTVILRDGAVILAPADAPAPDYTTDLSNLVVKNDFNSKVTLLSGTVDLDFHTIGGDAYLTFHGQDLSASTFAQLDALWTAGASGSVAIADDAGTVSLAASSLVTVGDTLPETSSVVVMRSEGGVTTYQALAIAFAPH
jgi:hypothetical protein